MAKQKDNYGENAYVVLTAHPTLHVSSDEDVFYLEEQENPKVDLTPNYPNYQVLVGEFLGVKKNRYIFQIIDAELKPSQGPTEKIVKSLATGMPIGIDIERVKNRKVLEDLSRRGFLGGLAGLGAAAAGLDAEAGTKKIKSPSQQTIQQAQTQTSTKSATPSKDPKVEAMLYRTAKASGMKGSELAQFLAQTKHESWDHSKLQEVPQGDPKQYFAKKYDPNLAPKTAKILGNVRSGDGEKYHGRGFIQLTGRDNYRMASKALNIDLLNNPELAKDPAIAAKIALWYWDTRVKPKVRNFDDTVAVTKTINNAMFGLEDRLANFIDYKKRVA
jgi:predicted chitinase